MPGFAPDFAIQGGVGLALARAFSVAMLMLAFGSVLYIRLVAPAGLRPEDRRLLRRLAWWSVGAAVLGALVWLAAQTFDFADGVSPADVWAVLADTMFGHLLAARLVLLLLAGGLWGAGFEAGAVVAAGLALVLQAGHGHGVAMGGPLWLIAAGGLHVLAAGAWLGALPALAVVVALADGPGAQAASARFSWLGYGCVGIVLVTAAAQFSVLVIGLPGLLGTAYGWMVCAKMLGFAALLVLAARNRFSLAPDLAGKVPRKSALRRAIVAETAIGLLVVCAAGVLSELAPPMHVQAIWPFGWLPSLDAAREDPDIAHEVAFYGGVLSLGAVLMLGSLIAGLRRRPWLAGGSALAGVALVVLALPHFSPLLVPAEPTVFYHSPTGFSAASIVAGHDLFAANCVRCHGAEGRGDGPAAKTLAMPPADLTAAHLWMHPDGELFWWLSHGIENPEGGLAMPGFAHALSADDLWALIDYIHAHNTGLSPRPNGGWAMHVQAPDFALVCGDQALTLADLRGSTVQIVFARAQMVVIRDTQTCRADDAGVALAYAVVTGAESGAVLVDAHGWLRQFAPRAAGLDAREAAKPMPERDTKSMNMKM